MKGEKKQVSFTIVKHCLQYDEPRTEKLHDPAAARPVRGVLQARAADGGQGFALHCTR
jgi:hypothetical protein